MHRRGLLAALAVCPLCVRQARADVDWSWTGDKGPEHWGSLQPGYASCASGQQQSPIDITDTISGALPPLRFAWAKDAHATIVNPGYTIRVNMPPGGTLRVGDAAYELIEFHFHAPSEHAVDGKRTAMEVHFVHQRAAGGGFGEDPVHGGNDWEAEPHAPALSYGVIGVRIAPGAAHAGFAAIARAMPAQSGGQAPITVTPADLLPRERGYWYYEGSLTTPSCSEVVSWMVLRAPITAAAADIARFTALYPTSARPLQARNRRLIVASR
jgi:carbonic anhydrase